MPELSVNMVAAIGVTKDTVWKEMGMSEHVPRNQYGLLKSSLLIIGGLVGLSIG
jgi:hypothetical protein